MLHRRHTITVATSALFFICCILYAQTNATLQGPVAYNDAEAYTIYESLLPTDWTVTAARTRRLRDGFVALNKTAWLLQPALHLDLLYEFVSRDHPDSAHSYFVLSPMAFNADKTLAVVYMGCGGGTFHVLEKKEGVWKNLRWKGTSCAWAS